MSTDLAKWRSWLAKVLAYTFIFSPHELDRLNLTEQPAANPRIGVALEKTPRHTPPPHSSASSLPRVPARWPKIQDGRDPSLNSCSPLRFPIQHCAPSGGCVNRAAAVAAIGVCDRAASDRNPGSCVLASHRGRRDGRARGNPLAGG